ncbi:MAG: hypothetical protein HC830_11250 [Bacteroidetes bacterium]|nr:hypothetical protein [Bacteroidota bacterium]
MPERAPFPPDKYAGAPYIRQLNTGEVIMSYQSNEFRTTSQWDLSDMIVCVGDSTGQHFDHKSIPFAITDKTKTCLWNSLFVESDTTIIALGSTNAYSNKTEVRMIRGYLSKH